MHFLFIYLPRDGFFINRKTRCLFPPLGAMYLSAVLEKEGHKATIIDLRAEGEKALRKFVLDADIVGITVETTSLNNCRKIIELIRQIDRDVPILIGGPHCNIVKEKALKELNADYEIVGEGEVSIAKIAKMLEGKEEERNIVGLCYLKNGKTYSNPPAIVDNLDTLPFPAHHLVKKYNYGYIGGIKIFPGRFMSMITSRGCPFKCKFCSRSSLYFDKYRVRSPKNVLEEIKYLYEKGYKNIIFVDDNFLTDKKRVEEIMDGIIKEEIDMNFIIEGARVDSADYNLYRKMKEAGVKLITYGIESGNQEILDYYNKGITLEQIKYAINLADQMNFITIGNFILGAPIEDEKHIQNTIEFAKELPLDVASFFILEYIVGSELWNEAVKEGKIGVNEYIVESDASKGLGKLTRKRLEEMRRRANLQFYFRIKYAVHEILKFLRMKNIYLAKGISTVFACSRCVKKRRCLKK